MGVLEGMGTRTGGDSRGLGLESPSVLRGSVGARRMAAHSGKEYGKITNLRINCSLQRD